MATLGTNEFTPSGDNRIDALILDDNGDVTRWDQSGGVLTISYSFANSASTFTPFYDSIGLGEPNSNPELTEAEKTAVREALAAWEAVANIEFVEVADGLTNPSGGVIRFGRTSVSNGNADAWAYLPSSFELGGDVWFRNQFLDDPFVSLEPGSNGFNVILHEIGHALGLEHSFEGTETLAEAEDWLGNTLMSGTQGWIAPIGTDFPSGPSDLVFPVTPSAYDILAIQYLYGVNTTHNSGNDVYGPNFEAGELFTIWDTGGTDTISYAGELIGIAIDLAQDGWSGAAANDLTTAIRIAEGSVIENAVGSAHNDTVSGNDADNTITAGGGDDMVSGGAGNDSVFGGGGNDFIEGGDDIDLLRGGTGADSILGGAGADTLNGNDGNDTLEGQSGDDTISGADGFDRIMGGGGNDWITGSARADTIEGGGGNDLVRGGAGMDVVFGDAGNDFVLGSGGPDQLFGGSGNDDMRGQWGNDTMTGGAGSDTFRYDASLSDGITDTDRILDFVQGEDLIALVGGVTQTQVLNGANVEMTLSTGDVVIIVGVGALLTASDFA